MSEIKNDSGAATRKENGSSATTESKQEPNVCVVLALPDGNIQGLCLNYPNFLTVLRTSKSNSRERLEEQKQYHERLSDEFVLSEVIKNHYRALENDELGHSNKALELLGRNLNLWKEQPKVDDQVAGLFAWLSADDAVKEPQGTVTVLPPPTEEDTAPPISPS